MKITNDLFSSYVRCKYKAVLKAGRKIGIISNYEKFQMEKESEFKAKAVRKIIEQYGESQVLYNRSYDLSELHHSKPILLGVEINYQDIQIQVDALENLRAKSGFESFGYIPILFIYKNKIGKEEKLLLAFLAYALGKAQRIKIQYGKFLHGEPPRLRKMSLAKFEAKVHSLITKIRGFSEKNKNPRVLLNKHCSTCEFQKQCEKEARDKDDLSLLKGMKEKEIEAQNNKGIFTVSQYSYTFRPRRRRKRVKSPIRGRCYALQALAIREQKVFVYQKPDIQTSKVRIYMDIESDPDRDFVYLIGLIIESENGERTYSFWADSQEQQNSVVEQFLGVVKDLDNYLLFHYGSLETKFFGNLKKFYSGRYKGVLDTVIKRSVNVLSLIFENFYFPVYDNSLKSIAGHLGFQWSEQNPSGLNSIVLRNKWERNQSDSLKERLVLYNIEDCYAVREVMKCLHRVCCYNDDKGTNIETSELNLVDNIRFDDTRRFGKNDFIIEDFEYINRCAYFDYQRDKVFVRTNRGFSKKFKRNIKRKKRSIEPNKIIELRSIQRCPYCGCKKIYRHDHYPRLVTDLRFLKNHGGVKRWLVRYLVYRYMCTECGRTYAPKTRKRLIQGRYGWSLAAWVIYENIFNGLSFVKIQKNLEDIFGLSISRTTLHRFKSSGASYYRSTYKKIFNKIIQSPVVHVDETQFRLRQEAGYVWVFTNTEEVVFAYKSTREGNFIWELLENYDGVLVSDFYGAYDSLNCAQQKCLIHLIRDLNTDLYNNPFDEELRSISQNFGVLLRTCVETIDRYGLKKRYLKKHIKDVERFYKKIINRNYSSETALQYQKRFQKNRDKLFTFLSHNGVPWNNNNVEHAIKHFAVYRRMVNGLLNEKGLNDYLVLLSIYQTCNYKQQNFLDFLLSRKREFS